jgi:hypothetical protein
VLAAAALAVVAFASLRGDDPPAAPATTPSSTATTAGPTTSAPTSTTTPCAQLESQLDALKEQLKSLDDVFKGDASGKAAAKKQLEADRKALERSLGKC